MEYEITEERRRYLDARGYTILMACPGSGKTTSIVYKLKQITEELEALPDKGNGLLCLSFTNKACEEITNKYCEFHKKSLAYPHLVSTIDSFITQYIVMPFWYLCDFCQSKPRIINEKDLLRNFFYRGDYLPFQFKTFNEIARSYPPEKIQNDYSGYKIDRTCVNEYENEKLLNYCNAMTKYKLEHGILNSSDALWLACFILKNNPLIAQTIANRFPYMIIDEAQDTSNLQFALFGILRDAGVKSMEFVGDINQSIYEWRNAKPDILDQYSKSEDWQGINFTKNRRSVQRIINLYSKLKPSNSPDIESYDVEDKMIPIIIYRYNVDMQKDVVNKFISKCVEFELNSKLILARGKTKIKQLSAEKDPIRIWKSNLAYKVINAQIAYTNNRIRDAINEIKWVVAELKSKSADFIKVKNYLKDNEKDVNFNILLLDILSNLPALSLSFSEWHNQITSLLENKLELESKPDFQFKQRIAGHKIAELKQAIVADYFGRNREKTIVAQTIHSVKGASVDAVLLFLDQNKTSGGISIKDIPADLIESNQIKEKHRLIYVACSRAKQFLALAISSSIPKNDIRNIFGGLDIQIVDID